MITCTRLGREERKRPIRRSPRAACCCPHRPSVEGRLLSSVWKPTHTWWWSLVCRWGPAGRDAAKQVGKDVFIYLFLCDATFSSESFCHPFKVVWRGCSPIWASITFKDLRTRQGRFPPFWRWWVGLLGFIQQFCSHVPSLLFLSLFLRRRLKPEKASPLFTTDQFTIYDILFPIC